jgi:hypothetical protein
VATDTAINVTTGGSAATSVEARITPTRRVD